MNLETAYQLDRELMRGAFKAAHECAKHARNVDLAPSMRRNWFDALRAAHRLARSYLRSIAANRACQFSETYGAQRAATRDRMQAAYTRDFGIFPNSDAARDIAQLLDSAEQNANDTVLEERAAPVSDWDSLFIGTLRSELSCGANWSRGAVEWFAAQGVEA